MVHNPLACGMGCSFTGGHKSSLKEAPQPNLSSASYTKMTPLTILTSRWPQEHSKSLLGGGLSLKVVTQAFKGTTKAFKPRIRS